MPYGQQIKESPKFPQIATCCLHVSKESMWELGEGIGLTGKALQLFKYALCEITVEISINKDGTYEILKIGE